MPGTFSQVLLHIVFSTKGRQPWITEDVLPRLHEYIGGIVRSERGVLLAIGGVEDHVHLYVKWQTEGAISDLMRNVKARSSAWVHQTFPARRDFAWQEGYAVFSVSRSREDVVKAYIANQAEHHRQESFKAILRRHGVEFDERYVFE